MSRQIHIRVYSNVSRYSLNHRLICPHSVPVWGFCSIIETLQRASYTPRMAFSDSQRENRFLPISQLPEHQTVTLGIERDTLR